MAGENRENAEFIFKCLFLGGLFLEKVASLGKGYVCQRDLDCQNMMQRVTLVHYINDIMLIKPDKQEVASVLEPLKRHMCSRRWEINTL